MEAPRDGFKIPEIKFNPATELKEAANMPINEGKNNTFVEEEQVEISFTERALAATSDRLTLQHQQLYFAFTICVFSFQICGKFIVKILTAIYE